MLQQVITPRLTVAGLVICPGGEYPLIPIHWPEAAARAGAYNLTTVGGGILPDESSDEAMKRELFEEYGIVEAEVFPISHRQFVSDCNGKEYVWCLVVCATRPQIVPLEGEVRATGWYSCPQVLRQGVRQMNPFKRAMFQEVFLTACSLYPEHFGAYVQYVGRLRKMHRKRKARA